MKTLLMLVGVLLVASLAIPAPADAWGRIFLLQHFGCQNADTYNRIVRYIYQGDDTAATHLLAGETMQGRCAFFEAGERVYTSDVSGWSGLIKVRKPGQTAEFWTGLKMVR